MHATSRSGNPLAPRRSHALAALDPRAHHASARGGTRPDRAGVRGRRLGPYHLCESRGLAAHGDPVGSIATRPKASAGLLSDRPRSGRPKRLTPADEADDCPPDPAHRAAGRLRHALEYAGDGRGDRPAPLDDCPRLARPRAATAPVRTFKLSTDPEFVTKLRDVVGLYLNPPERAVVFAFDEKSQIQALDRTQPRVAFEAGPCRDVDA